MSLIDNLELRKLVACVIDEAIATVAEEEFNRLCEITNNVALVGENIKAALESLAKLRDGLEPEYNEWDALFYVTWYQPRQINLALSILQELYQDVRKWQGPDLPLHIIDVGCGALAVQFAMAILATECHREGDNVTVTGIDPSEAMRKIGESLWLEFWTILDKHPGKHPELSDLARFCDYMTSSCESFDSYSLYCSSKVDRPQVMERTECWMIALHAIYESNKDKIKEALQTLYGQYSPRVRLVTCHESKLSVARSVAGGDFRCHILSSNMLPFQGELSNTTEWRRHLVKKLPNNLLRSVEGLLKRPAEWAPDKTTAVLARILRGD